MVDIKNVIGDYEDFLDKVYANLVGVGIDVSNYQIDHIAYRADTEESFKKVKMKLLKLGVLVKEVFYSGRLISFIKVDSLLIELMATAPGGHKYGDRLEHLEIIISESLEEFMKKYPNVTFNKNFLNKGDDSHLIIDFPNGANVKFRNNSIII